MPEKRPSLLRRWRRLDRADRRLLSEVFVFLVCARIAILALPFRRVVRLADGADRRPIAARAMDLGRLRWAIRAVARRMPFRALCFEQGLAARFILRRRGVPTTLYYGAVRETDGRLMTHVWIRTDDLDVIGTENVDRYALLGSFPPVASAVAG